MNLAGYPQTETEFEMSISVIEIPLTERERSQIEPPSWDEVGECIGEASTKFDACELGDVCAIAYEQIAELIADKDATALGNYVMFLRRQRIADLASRQMYGHVGEIFAAQVKV